MSAPKVKTLDDAEVRAVALAWLAGNLVCTTLFHESDSHLVPLVFMPVAFGAIEQYAEAERAKIAGVYAIFGRERNCGRAVNGYPIFAECRVMSEADWERVRTLARALHAAQAAVPTPPATTSKRPARWTGSPDGGTTTATTGASPHGAPSVAPSPQARRRGRARRASKHDDPPAE